MLKFFFNRYSVMVRLMGLVGLAGIFGILWFAVRGRLAPLQLILFITIMAEYAFLLYCMMRRWYPDLPRSYGITLQFEKALVPANYILATMSWLFVLLKSSAVLAVAVFLLTVIAHVNVILIFLHFKDRDKTPVNTFSMTH